MTQQISKMQIFFLQNHKEPEIERFAFCVINVGPIKN